MDARFVQHRRKTWLTCCGNLTFARAYYHCGHCHKGHCPFDAANDLLADGLSAGVRPLVCLAGTLDSFRDSSDDLLLRFSSLRVSASTVRLVTEKAGERLGNQQRNGDIVHPDTMKPWDFRVDENRTDTVAYLGLDAFAVPMQRSGGAKTEHRMLYTATMYTPDKSKHHYLVDFDLDRVVSQLRQAAIVLGLSRADRIIALTDAGSGLEEALRRHFRDDLLCILDWYHATQHLHDYSRCRFASDASGASAWCDKMKTILYEQGGALLVARLREETVPAEAGIADELRKLINYFADNVHRTDYPYYLSQGWDIGSGPTEAACKVVGTRLKESGMRWLVAGAAQVAPLRALYMSGADAWDAFWALAA